MGAEVAVRVEGLGKLYEIGAAPSRSSLYDGMARLLGAKIKRPTDPHPTVWALRNVSFEVPQGHILGVLGRNGSGKSTLLKILARITFPTEGKAELHGRVGALLEVGTGFHPELSGRDNIALSGAILGLKRRDILAVEEQVIDFAEIGRFVDTAVKHYSSGMFLRLAFSVAAHMPAPIMLLDEVLAVGDAAFQIKCRDRIRHIVSEGRTVLFVSHAMASVRTLCDSAIVLDEGTVRFTGPPADACDYYSRDILGLPAEVADFELDASGSPRR